MLMLPTESDVLHLAVSQQSTKQVEVAQVADLT